MVRSQAFFCSSISRHVAAALRRDGTERWPQAQLIVRLTAGKLQAAKLRRNGQDLTRSLAVLRNSRFQQQESLEANLNGLRRLQYSTKAPNVGRFRPDESLPFG